MLSYRQVSSIPPLVSLLLNDDGRRIKVRVGSSTVCIFNYKLNKTLHCSQRCQWKWKNQSTCSTVLLRLIRNEPRLVFIRLKLSEIEKPLITVKLNWERLDTTRALALARDDRPSSQPQRQQLQTQQPTDRSKSIETSRHHILHHWLASPFLDFDPLPSILNSQKDDAISRVNEYESVWFSFK